MKIQIKARFTDAVLFECEIDSETPERERTRAALQKAVAARADLAGACLAGADLAGAYLAGAYLVEADLAGADLAGAIYDILPATKDESVAALDKVREIILDNRERLNMGLWHEDDGWTERTCAEETMCGTTHCLAGWLQVCSTNEKIRKLPNVEMAGTLAAPIARTMFFESQRRALEWLEKREYAKTEEA